MASRYHRSRTPDPDMALQRRSAMSPVPQSRSKIASMKSAGTWGSMSNLDQILNNLQESIQQKTRECCNSYESLDRLDSDDEVPPRDKGLNDSPRTLPVINLDAPRSPKEQKTSPFGRKDRVSSQYTDQVLFRAPKSTLPNPGSDTGSGRVRDLRRNTVHGVNFDPSSSEPSGNLGGFADLTSSSRTESSGSNLTKWRSSAASDTNHNDRTSPLDTTDTSSVNDNTPPPSVFAHGLSTRGAPHRDLSPSGHSVRYEYSGFANQQARNQFNSHDMNNNSAQSQSQQQQSYSPRFTKNPTSRTTRQSKRVFPSITRTRSGAESPVAIKHASVDTKVEAPSSPEMFIPASGSQKLFTPIENGLPPRTRRDLPSESSFDVTSLSSEPVSTYSRSESDSSISLSTPRSRWGRAEVGHSELLEISSLAEPVTPEPSPSPVRKKVNAYSSKVVPSSSNIEMNSLNTSEDPEQPVAPPRRPGRNHLSPTRKMWEKPKRGMSPLAQSLHVEKQGEETPNKSLAFYVPYSEESQDLSPGAMFNNSYAKAKVQRDIDEDEEDDQSVKFPQWVIPFIDDKLTGQFEYDGKNISMKKRSRSMPPARSIPPNRSRNITSPTPQQPRISGPRESRSRAPTRSNPPQTQSSTPIPPPRTRKLNTDTTRSKPAAKTVGDSRPTTKADPPRKKLPMTPTTQSKTSKSEVQDESELFPIHYVQYPSGPSVPSRSKTKPATSSPRNPPAKSTPSSWGPPPSNLSKFSTRGDSDSSGRTSSSLASRRSKSMGNLSLISGGDRKESSARKTLDKTRSAGKDAGTTSRLQVSQTSKATTDNSPSVSQTTGSKPAAQPAKNQTNSTSSRRSIVPSSRSGRVQSTSSEDSRDRKSSAASKSSVTQGRLSRASSATRLNADNARSLSVPKDKSSPATTSKPDKTSSLTPGRLRTVAAHNCRDSSESESSNSVYSEGRTSSRTTPRILVRSLSRQDSDSSSGAPDHSQTFTLPRRRSQFNDSTHEGGYATMRPSKTSTPKKSILKTAAVPSSIPEREIPGETSRAGRRALPRVPQDNSSPARTPTTSRLSQLRRSTSREDVPAKPKTNLTKNRTKSMENLSEGLTSRTRPKSSSRPTSPSTSRGGGGDSLRIRPRSPVLPSGHVISDRYRRLMDGDFGQAQGQAQGQGQGQGQAGAASAQNDTLNVEKENSFDSGVEFTMHL